MEEVDGGTVCLCDPGYTGASCQTDINYCSPDPCENGGTCNDLPTAFSCDCPPAWTGDTCGTGERAGQEIFALGLIDLDKALRK